MGFADVLDVNLREKSKETPVRCGRMELGKRNLEFSFGYINFFVYCVFSYCVYMYMYMCVCMYVCVLYTHTHIPTIFS